MSIIPDTSTIINHPSVLDQENLTIPYCVLGELDNLKDSSHSGYQARRATQKILSRKIPTKEFDTSADKVDNQLLEISEKEKVFTDDVLLYLKGQSNNLNVELYSPPDDSIYTGVKKYRLTNGKKDKLYDGKTIKTDLDLYPNQFVDSDRVLARYYDNGLHKVDWNPNLLEGLDLNRRQKMAVDLLMDSDVSVVGLHGPAGTGKTSLALEAAFQQIKYGEYDKLVVSAPKIQRGRQQETLGYLPGDVDEKLEPWLKPFFDNVQTQHHAQFETLPLSMIQGRNLQNTVWLITEFQNVRGTEADQIIERVGSGSKLIYEGDINQRTVKSAYDGLTVMTNALKGRELAGAVRLNEVERSETAKLGETVRNYLG